MAAGGSASVKQNGSVVGLVDIGESEDAYLFRVSLPGVKRDENELSCKVETDGKVIIRGVKTTGKRYVYRFSQLFAMQSSNISPPGPFSIEFQLPGPVNPQQFSANYGTDGVLEGIVMKKDSEDIRSLQQCQVFYSVGFRGLQDKNGDEWSDGNS